MANRELPRRLQVSPEPEAGSVSGSSAGVRSDVSEAYRGVYGSDCVEEDKELWLFANRSSLVWAVWAV